MKMGGTEEKEPVVAEFVFRMALSWFYPSSFLVTTPNQLSLGNSLKDTSISVFYYAHWYTPIQSSQQSALTIIYMK